MARYDDGRRGGIHVYVGDRMSSTTEQSLPYREHEFYRSIMGFAV